MVLTAGNATWRMELLPGSRGSAIGYKSTSAGKTGPEHLRSAMSLYTT